jgi:hypothetical protein
VGYDLTEEALRALVLDENAPATFVPFNYSSNAAEKRCRVKTGASYLFGLTVTNSNAAARFIHVFDMDSFPADGAVPNVCLQVATIASAGAQWIPARRMDRGILICGSTTQLTLTLGAAEFLFDVQYV